jgi:pimeloyl-ACP methyl ester carboxylesterase
MPRTYGCVCPEAVNGRPTTIEVPARRAILSFVCLRVPATWLLLSLSLLAACSARLTPAPWSSAPTASSNPDPRPTSAPNEPSKIQGAGSLAADVTARDAGAHDAGAIDDSIGDAQTTSTIMGRHWALRVAEAVEARGRTLRARNVVTPRWTWIELCLFDQTYPLTIDILGSNQSAPRGVVYMLPGGATNFRSSFMVPPEDNIASFFRRRGYLVIGITPREDMVSADTRDLSFMAAWDMKQHRDDIRNIVQLVQAIVPLPYELLGHSYGAASAIDYAGAYPGEVQRVVALDIYSFDSAVDPTSMRMARRTHQAYLELMREGVLADTSFADFPALVRSGLGRPDAGAAAASDYGRYTSKQLLLFGLIYSAVLPGVHSDITGLPGDWPIAMSEIAGDEGWEFRPDDDNRTFARTSFATLRLAADELGSGLISMAFARDYWSVVAETEGGYPLRWSNHAGKVLWINSELGYNDQMHGADLMRQAGNPNVETQIVPQYGHADLLWSRTAHEDVWERFAPAPP